MASTRLDADRARLYFDLIRHSLSEAARKALQTMNPAASSDELDAIGERLLSAASIAEALGVSS